MIYLSRYIRIPFKMLGEDSNDKKKSIEKSKGW